MGRPERIKAMLSRCFIPGYPKHASFKALRIYQSLSFAMLLQDRARRETAAEPGRMRFREGPE